MCYAIPGKVKQFEGDTVVVDYFGEERKARNELDDLKRGDYIYAQGGYVIEKIPPAEAHEVLAVWKETFFELQEVDLRLSRMDLEREGLDRDVGRILDRTFEGGDVRKKDLVALLSAQDDATNELIGKAANFLRQKHLKNSCCVHGILEISNYCRRQCAYCGISALNATAARYRMSFDEIMHAATEAVEKYGFKALVLQSGEDPAFSVDELCHIVREIKRRAPSLIFISFGEVGLDGLERLHEAGARGLLMRFETSDPVLYERLHPGMSLDDRLSHLRKADELGYLILTGGLIGLPGQTIESLADDLLLTRELNAEMYSFGPLMPHPHTPLFDESAVDPGLVLKMLAAARLLDPVDAKILITTAFETLSPDARQRGLLAGGNSVMLNVTPVANRGKYSIYENRHYVDASIQTQIEETIGLLGSLGRAPTDLSVRG